MYDWLYRLGFTPWVPAGAAQGEMLATILEREEAWHRTGRTLVDLGCGSGEHTLAAARRGWRVVGVDASPTAIERARRAARAAGIDARFLVGDVRRLPEVAGLPGEVDLWVDVGCYHGLDPAGRRALAEGVRHRSAARASLLVVGMDRSPGRWRVGVTAAGLAEDFPGWRVEGERSFPLGGKGPLRRVRFRVYRLTRPE